MCTWLEGMKCQIADAVLSVRQAGRVFSCVSLLYEGCSEGSDCALCWIRTHQCFTSVAPLIATDGTLGLTWNALQEKANSTSI